MSPHLAFDQILRLAAQRCLWVLLPLGIALVGSLTARAWADQKPPVGPYVAGYADQLSVAPGDELAFRISASAPSANMTIERVGPSNQQVFARDGIATQLQPIPDRASSDGCKWPESYRLKIPADWQSGYYQVTLSIDHAGTKAQGTTFFIVRSAQPGSHSPILLQLATNTYNAYTNWGGHSLYGFHDRDGIQGHRVSFDRPVSSQFDNWEGPFVRWAEARGYKLEYAANSDLELRPEMLKHYRLVLSVGHDEYWSAPMRDHLDTFISGGGNVAFFSGNTCCWQVRSEENARALTSWKQHLNVDPLFRSDREHLLSTLWSHHRVQRPENQLTGVGFLWGGYHRSHGQMMEGPASYEIHRPDHWILAGTGLKAGDRFGGKDTIVGYECDGCEMRWQDHLPYPTGRDGTPENFTIIGTCPARWAPDDCYWYERFPKDRIGAAVMGVYTRGGTVFTCGSTDWAHGLKGGDPAVAQITSNILERLSKEAQP